MVTNIFTITTASSTCRGEGSVCKQIGSEFKIEEQGWAVVAHAFIPSSWEAKVGGSL